MSTDAEKPPTLGGGAVTSYSDLSKSVCDATLALAVGNIDELHGKEHAHISTHRVAINILHLAFCQSICNEFFAVIEPHADLTSKIPIAEKLMKDDFPNFMEAEMKYMACGTPGVEVAVIYINGKKAVPFNYLLSLNPVPVIACYLNQVCEVMDAAEAVKNVPVREDST